MKPAAFSYHRARDVTGAVALLSELAAAGEDPKLLAGGQSLVPMMSFRLARPSALVDLGGLRRRGELTGITPQADGSLRIGALTTHHEVETSAATGRDYRVLRRAMRWVGHLPIRTRGTVAGSLVHGDATAEWCLLALLCDARIVVEGPGGRREIPAGEMFHGFYATEVEPDELVTEVVFTRPAPHAALTEFAQRHGDFAVVDAAVALDRAPDGTLLGGRVVLGGVAPAPVRVPVAEAELDGGPASFAACADAAAAGVDPPADAHGSSDYRRHLVRTLVTRACEQAWDGAKESHP
ncbi:FAD binding domain-containing protein [Pseudonocardia sp. KRD-184]|uniref:FAD binding domain-containing protein n=1 Tax=Pseudonocardia oceani TaxID=2792013 RepID=A0ABS6U8C8_9PSEU|nr:FAD binding domain-containing protein [Pseudonocardia oceani]MBW0088684.1 FAD binding domain-containing protein [Pseudonocardia oceani]MBW0095561.1 FAD binding domain-containing protein [Pseudonocardia oceani]MBW0108201.1 FAD binding domain-containing protein [Pseudonocardia oceani]MBW0120662.1 FAD binding domain-containing protein [Pseudonocardia oceani]MBW0128404.1 FAD binding domain-containing protein [Pseudonocardia oceani]